MIRILPYIIKTEPKEDDKEKKFVSLIQKPKPNIKRQNGQRQIFFIK